MPNESAKIILSATHGKLSKVRDALAVEGTINALKVSFQFVTSDWNDTTKTVVFVRGRATPSTINEEPVCIILDESNECNVPPEILAKEGIFSVGVFGTRDDYRIVSNWICYKIDNGCYADGNIPIDPSSTIYEQIIAMINNKSEIGHNHDERYYTKEKSDELFDNVKAIYDNTKMDKENPNGTGSFSLNRKHNTIIGIGSFAEGENTTASGDYSHAEGSGTTALSTYQHVQGKYNINDSSDTYADIIGNGIGDTVRSNAATVDWSGNAWFAGTVRVGGTGQDDDNAKVLASEHYVDLKYATNTPKYTTITLSAINWMGSVSPYSQTITIDGITSNSKIDLFPTASQIAQLQDDETTLVSENNNGTVIIYAIGGKPTIDYEIQITITNIERTV